MLTIVQTRNDLLSKLGIEDASLAEPLVLQDVVIAINGAMQILQTAGEDYFTRQFLDIPLIAGTTFYTLQNTQSVIGPIRWNNSKPLRALDSQGQFDQFSRIYNDGTGYGAGTTGEPEAYWIETGRNQLSEGNICEVRIYIAPCSPTPSGSLTVEAIRGAVAYNVGNLADTTVVPVAQNYTESIFLPIARMLITRSSQFSRPDILKQLETDYNWAMETLGFKGGFPNAVQPVPERQVNA